MGLDLVVEGCARRGHEAEWRLLLERDFAGGQLSDSEAARFVEISIPGYERIEAARVGQFSLGDQLGIVRAAGRWFVFWGERSHPIRACF